MQWTRPCQDRVHTTDTPTISFLPLLSTTAASECGGMPQVLLPGAAATYARMSLAAYLARHRYSETFRRNYLLPMCAAVWSVPNAQVGQLLCSWMHCT